MSRRIAAAGLALTAAMQVWFAFNGQDRPASYLPVQLVSVAASLVAAYGLSRLDAGGAAWMAIGFGVNAITRLLQVLLDLTRLPIWLNFALSGGYVVALFVAGAWASGRHRPDRLRLAFALLALVHFVALLTALSRLSAAFGLALGCAGFALAAGMVEGEKGPQV